MKTAVAAADPDEPEHHTTTQTFNAGGVLMSGPATGTTAQLEVVLTVDQAAEHLNGRR
jgi:predicted TIM-barrel enzyme